MKTLKAYVVANESSKLNSFKEIIDSMKGMQVVIETNIEAAVDAISQQNFDLLIIDKALSNADYNKLHKLVDLLHPDAAVIAFHMTDEDFIRYKLSGLWSKWMDAQSDGKTNFIDNPKL